MSSLYVAFKDFQSSLGSRPGSTRQRKAVLFILASADVRDLCVCAVRVVRDVCVAL